MDLTFQAPLVRHAESARPPMRSPSTSVRCFNCSQTGHMRAACRALRRPHSAMPFRGGFGQRVSRSPRSNADAFRAGRERIPSVFYADLRTTSRGSVLPVWRVVGTLPSDEFRLCSSSPLRYPRCVFPTKHPVINHLMVVVPPRGRLSSISTRNS